MNRIIQLLILSSCVCVESFIKVTTRQHDRYMMITVNMCGQNTTDMSHVYLDCIFNSDTNKVLFTRDESLYDKQFKGRVTHNSSGCTTNITLSQLRRDDVGNYTCKCTNMTDRTSASECFKVDWPDDNNSDDTTPTPGPTTGSTKKLPMGPSKRDWTQRAGLIAAVLLFCPVLGLVVKASTC